MLGSKLKSLRKRNEMSQFEVSELVGVKQQTLSNWESGKQLPTDENMERLAKIYNVSVDELLEEISKGGKKDTINILLKTMVSTGIIKDADNIDQSILDILIAAIRAEVKEMKKEAN